MRFSVVAAAASATALSFCLPTIKMLVNKQHAHKADDHMAQFRHWLECVCAFFSFAVLHFYSHVCTHATLCNFSSNECECSIQSAHNVHSCCPFQFHVSSTAFHSNRWTTKNTNNCQHQHPDYDLWPTSTFYYCCNSALSQRALAHTHNEWVDGMNGMCALGSRMAMGYSLNFHERFGGIRNRYCNRCSFV